MTLAIPSHESHLLIVTLIGIIFIANLGQFQRLDASCFKLAAAFRWITMPRERGWPWLA